MYIVCVLAWDWITIQLNIFSCCLSFKSGARVVAFDEHHAVLVVSKPSPNQLFPGFGVVKVSTNLFLKVSCECNLFTRLENKLLYKVFCNMKCKYYVYCLFVQIPGWINIFQYMYVVVGKKLASLMTIAVMTRDNYNKGMGDLCKIWRFIKTSKILTTYQIKSAIKLDQFSVRIREPPIAWDGRYWSWSDS